MNINPRYSQPVHGSVEKRAKLTKQTTAPRRGDAGQLMNRGTERCARAAFHFKAFHAVMPSANKRYHGQRSAGGVAISHSHLSEFALGGTAKGGGLLY